MRDQFVTSNLTAPALTVSWSIRMAIMPIITFGLASPGPQPYPGRIIP